MAGIGFILIIVTVRVDGGDFEWIGGGDFQIGAAFGTLECIALLDLIYIDIQRVIAFRANNSHGAFLLPREGGYAIFS